MTINRIRRLMCCIVSVNRVLNHPNKSDCLLTVPLDFIKWTGDRLLWHREENLWDLRVLPSLTFPTFCH